MCLKAPTSKADTAFFFEEGQAKLYARAGFAILRVAADGAAVLAGLADAQGHPLGE